MTNTDNDTNLIRLKQKIVTFVVGIAIPLFILGFGLFLLLPFYKPITWAIILALFFHPFYEKLNKRIPGNENINALLMCILITFFIVAPMLFLLGSMANEVLKIYNSFTNWFQTGDIFNPDKYENKYAKLLFEKINEIWNEHKETVRNTLNEIIRNIGQIFVSQSTALVKNIARFIMDLILMLTLLFYLLRDGKKVYKFFYELLPFNEENKKNFMSITMDILNATLYGNIMTALVQALCGVLILYLLGFSAPIMWGMLMGIASFIPIVGTSIIWWPQVVYLIFTGSYVKGIILMLSGMIIIGQIDYFLRPFFMATKTKVHNMILLLGIIGGLTMFGFLGLILGPLIMALCIAILEVFKLYYSTEHLNEASA